jgi:hypothetical protein
VVGHGPAAPISRDKREQKERARGAARSADCLKAQKVPASLAQIRLKKQNGTFLELKYDLYIIAFCHILGKSGEQFTWATSGDQQ